MDNRTAALLNVAVFTPLAIYAWRGKRPPGALLFASVIAGAAFFLRDLDTVLTPAEQLELEETAAAAQQLEAYRRRW